MVIFLNGVKIGIEIIHRGRYQIRWGQRRETAMCCGGGFLRPCFENPQLLPVFQLADHSGQRRWFPFGEDKVIIAISCNMAVLKKSIYDGLKFIFTRAKKYNEFKVQNFKVSVNLSTKFEYLL
jgi:hypothetical protein